MKKSVISVLKINSRYLQSPGLNDLTLPNPTWLYLDPANSNEHRLLKKLCEVSIEGHGGTLTIPQLSQLTWEPYDRQFYLWHLVYLDRFFYWVILRGAEPMWRLGDWQLSKCKCFAAFSLTTKSLTLICIYGDCNAILSHLGKNLDFFCSAFEIRLLLYQDMDCFTIKLEQQSGLILFSRMHFVWE